MRHKNALSKGRESKSSIVGSHQLANVPDKEDFFCAVDKNSCAIYKSRREVNLHIAQQRRTISTANDETDERDDEEEESGSSISSLCYK